MGYDSKALLEILTAEEIGNEEELLEFWFVLKDKLPVKAQKKVGDSLFHNVSRRRRLLGQIPVINILVDSFDPPPFEGIKETLNSIGLLAALTLTIAMTFPGVVTHDELVGVSATFIGIKLEGHIALVTTPAVSSADEH